MRPPIFGLLAEFDHPEDVIHAAEAARKSGYRRIDAFSPFPVEGLADALGHGHSRFPWLVLAGGIAGCVGGFLFQYWVSVVDLPLNVGGRPLNSWPAFIPVTFELTILAAAFTAVLGMLALNGLPMPYHPVFHVERFALASKDRFFFLVEARDPRFDLDATKKFMEGLKPKGVFEVPH